MAGETKAARLASQIERWIERDRLPAGTFLGKKTTLAQDHQVSVQTLNEALRILQGRGLVVVKPGPRGGTFVAASADRVQLSSSLLAAQDDPRQLGDLFQLQDALHELICVKAAAACTPADADRISLSVRGLTDQLGTPSKLRAIWEVDRQIAQVISPSVVATVYVMVLDMIASSVQRWPIEVSVSPETVAVHLEMARAVIANDIGGARAAARRHSPVDPAEGVVLGGP